MIDIRKKKCSRLVKTLFFLSLLGLFGQLPKNYGQFKGGSIIYLNIRILNFKKKRKEKRRKKTGRVLFNVYLPSEYHSYVFLALAVNPQNFKQVLALLINFK